MAEQYLREAIALNPNRPVAPLLLAVLAYSHNQAVQADEIVSTVLTHFPAIASFRYSDGLLRRKGKYSPANSWFHAVRQYMLHQAIDTFIISYPKCSGTWLRFLLGKYLSLTSALPIKSFWN